MPRSTMATRRALMLDAATELRDIVNGPIVTTTTSENPVTVEVWSLLKDFTCVVDSQPYTGYAPGSAYWQLSIEIASAAAPTFTPIFTVVLPGTQSHFELPLSGQWVEENVDRATSMRVTATKVGAPGNLSYGAFLSTAV